MNGSSRLVLVVALPAMLCAFFVNGAAAGEGGAASSVSAPVPAPTRIVAVPTAVIECPDCSDSNACTADSCDPLTGFCRHDALSCDDGDPCTADYCDQWGFRPGASTIVDPMASPARRPVPVSAPVSA